MNSETYIKHVLKDESYRTWCALCVHETDSAYVHLRIYYKPGMDNTVTGLTAGNIFLQNTYKYFIKYRPTYYNSKSEHALYYEGL